MSLPFVYCFLLLILPAVCFTCPDRFTCGDIAIDIFRPFYLGTAAGPNCTGKYMVRCDNGSKPVIKLDDREYILINIVYLERVLVIQDPYLSAYLSSGPGKCGFLYNFTNPIHHFHLPIHFPILSPPNPPQYCRYNIDVIHQTFFDKPYSCSPCKDYTVYRWDESTEPLEDAHYAGCLAAQPPLFQWMLSFSEYPDDAGVLSLLSAGFSHRSELRVDCLNCHVSGSPCNSSNDGAAGSSCLCENICETSGKTGSKDMKIKIGLILGSGGLLLACALLVIYLRCYNTVIFWVKKNNDQNIEDFLVKYRNMAPKRYTYSELKRITKSFHDKLGQGGYGTVFKGTLVNGREVAVKVLSESKGNGEEFLNEVSSIGMTSHVNIVSLLGFCYERSKRALIYEFMCNGSLDKFVYSGKPRTAPEWERLYNIAVGIARGLEYLHRGCSTRIVHFDIKPHNILLDQDFCPKISDFGLAKLCLKKESIISMAGFRGTIGYIAPEVFSRNFGVVSSKSDVYSYGMMVLEMVGGRKNATMDAERSSETYFPHWIYEHLKLDGDLQDFGITGETEESARKMTIVGLWCVQTNPQDRPTITKVIEMLEGNIDVLDVPPKPYLCTPLQSLVGTSSIHDGCWKDDRSSDHESSIL